MELNISGNIVEDRTAIELSFPTPMPRLTGAGLTQLINVLSQYRVLMQPVLSASPPDGEIPAVRDGGWLVKEEFTTEGAALLVCHPGAGWLGFVLSPPQIEKLRDALDRALALSAQRQQRPPN